MVQLLRSGRLDAARIQRIAGDQRLLTHYSVRAALVEQPATPPSTAMNILRSLFWRDLARVADDYRLYPPLRRRAEMLLMERSEEMAEGEMVALARIAGRLLIKQLSRRPEPRVIAALLGNPRLLEDDVVAISRGKHTAPETLAAVARCDRWSCSRPVCLALARNPSTPVADSLRSIGHLRAADLQRLAADTGVPRIVRVASERRIRSARPVASH